MDFKIRLNTKYIGAVTKKTPIKIQIKDVRTTSYILFIINLLPINFVG